MDLFFGMRRWLLAWLLADILCEHRHITMVVKIILIEHVIVQKCIICGGTVHFSWYYRQIDSWSCHVRIYSRRILYASCNAQFVKLAIFSNVYMYSIVYSRNYGWMTAFRETMLMLHQMWSRAFQRFLVASASHHWCFFLPVVMHLLIRVAKYCSDLERNNLIQINTTVIKTAVMFIWCRDV